jgi:hypothetical protein
MGVIKMTRREANAGILASAMVAVGPALAAEETTTIALPPPRNTGGKPLIEALKLRRSTREYSDRVLPPQILSDLLWSAFGVNRPSGDRTAPYWRHIMVIDVYTAMADGVWFYDPKRHALVLHSRDDIRVQTAEGVNESYACRILRLSLLAPSIVTAILDGRHDSDVMLKDLMKPLPDRWGEQIAALKFGA